jgi:hypothetical protein
MKPSPVDQIVHAVLYEGYLLYPYRPSSVKNRQRWTFGGLFPEAWCAAHGSGDTALMQTECLVVGGPDTSVEVTVRFLHILNRGVGELDPPADGPELSVRSVDAIQVGEQTIRPRQEAVEQRICGEPLRLADLVRQPRSAPFDIAPSRQLEPVPGMAGAFIVREQLALAGVVECSAARLAGELFRLTVRIHNRTPLTDPAGTRRDEAQQQAMISTHTVLHVCNGEFISLTDPPEARKEATTACRNIGTWPVLAGVTGATDILLSSPIILHDYPEVAPESPGDLFDGTEIDEILTLRILTLTDDEKREMSTGDERARALLQRTEALAQDQMLRLHGTIRSRRPLSGDHHG